jgi:hypothetical protein
MRSANPVPHLPRKVEATSQSDRGFLDLPVGADRPVTQTSLNAIRKGMAYQVENPVALPPLLNCSEGKHMPTIQRFQQKQRTDIPFVSRTSVLCELRKYFQRSVRQRQRAGNARNPEPQFAVKSSEYEWVAPQAQASPDCSSRSQQSTPGNAWLLPHG